MLMPTPVSWLALVILNSLTDGCWKSMAILRVSTVFGRRARVAIEQARRDICRYLALESDQLFFTSGGTEGNNLIIRSIIEKNKVPRIAITAGDHPSITTTVELLQSRGRCIVDVIAINHEGIVIDQQLAQVVRDETELVCLTYANSETGVINDVNALATKYKKIESTGAYPL